MRRRVNVAVVVVVVSSGGGSCGRNRNEINFFSPENVLAEA